MSEMPQGKQSELDGVGQLTLTFGFPKDAAEVAEINEPGASTARVAVPQNTAAAKEGGPRGPHKWHSLIDKVYALKNLQSAWERVRANRGAPGVDGMTIAKYAEHVDE